MKTFKQYLEERVKLLSKYEAMLAINPTQQDLDKVFKYAKDNKLSIHSYIDNLTQYEARMIYEITGDKWYVWTGQAMHRNIQNTYKLPDNTTVFGDVEQSYGELLVDLSHSRNYNYEYGDGEKYVELARRGIERLMKANGIRGKIENI